MISRASISIFILCVFLRGAAAQPDVNALAQQLLADPGQFPSSGHAEINIPLRDIGQTVWALQLANRNVEAAQVAERGLRALDQTKPSGRPDGSVAPWIRADARAAFPRCYVDAHAVSAILEAAWRHASAMEAKSGAVWASQWWPQIFAAGNFVVGWTRGPRGEPYPAYDPALGHDVGGPFESPGALLGVFCAQELARLAEKRFPETWRQRHEVLEILVRTTDFSDATRAQRLPWGLRGLRGILPDNHPLWLAPVMLGGEPHVTREAAWQVSPELAQQIIAAKAAKPEPPPESRQKPEEPPTK